MVIVAIINGNKAPIRAEKGSKPSPIWGLSETETWVMLTRVTLRQEAIINFFFKELMITTY